MTSANLNRGILFGSACLLLLIGTERGVRP